MSKKNSSLNISVDHDGRVLTPTHTPGWIKFSPWLIILSGLCVYANSFSGVFLFDDNRYIINNERIRSLWPIDAILTSRRPVVELTLAINYALGGLEVWGYHAINVAIHILSALVLYGLIRRTLQFKIFKSLNPSTTYILPFSIALLWVVHPLNTQSVTYIIQRSESCMGLFYLLTLYGFVRSVQSSRARGWSLFTVIFCAIGMGCKAVMITAPVMVLMYDYFFVSHSFIKALQAKPLMYTGLAATWGLLLISGLAQSIFFSTNPYATVGFGYHGLTPLAYALAQSGAILQYIKLSLWPGSLCLDYGWRIPQNMTVIIGPVVIIFGLLIVTIISFLKKHWAGFVGLTFFLILSPTSSIIPIKDLLFEHRMYLPLICVLIIVVVSARRLLDRMAAHFSTHPSSVNFISMGLVLIASSALGYKTYSRNKDYHNVLVMWHDVVSKRPDNARARTNYGVFLQQSGDLKSALEQYKIALSIDENDTEAHFNYGTALMANQQIDRAMEEFQATIHLEPNHTMALSNLGNVFASMGRNDEAIEMYHNALRITPNFAPIHVNLANTLVNAGRLEDAIKEYRKAIQLDPYNISSYINLGNALSMQGNIDEAVEQYEAALALNPNHRRARRSMERVLAGEIPTLEKK